MADQIVITEKSSQAKDVHAAVGSLYGDILPAEGHLFDLLEPEEVVPAWKRWSPILLRPEGRYGTRSAEGGNKAAKKAEGETARELEPKPVSPAQLLYAKKFAQGMESFRPSLSGIGSLQSPSLRRGSSTTRDFRRSTRLNVLPIRW